MNDSSVVSGLIERFHTSLGQGDRQGALEALHDLAILLDRPWPADSPDDAYHASMVLIMPFDYLGLQCVFYPMEGSSIA